MQKIASENLMPERFYWARRVSTGTLEIVQVSTVFGTALEFLTVALIGTDQHLVLEEFDFIEEIIAPILTGELDSRACGNGERMSS